MTFLWGNLSKSTQRELARAAGLKVTKAESELIANFGEPPTIEFIDAVWPTLRDGWILREPRARALMIELLQSSKVGNRSIKTRSRSGQMDYLRSCRMSDTLRKAAFEVLCLVGSTPFDAPSASSADPSADAPVSMNTVAQRGCATLRVDSMATVELAVCLAIGRELKKVTLPMSNADERHETVGAVVTAAFMAVYERSEQPVSFDGEVPPHRPWVATAAEKIAADAALADRVINCYVTQVDLILADPHPSTFNAAMTCLSVFFTTVGTLGTLDITDEDSVKLVEGLSWLLSVVATDGDEPPCGLAMDTPQIAGSSARGGTAADISSAAGADPAEQVPSLQAFVARVLRSLDPAVIGPGECSPGAVGWGIPAGSALVDVRCITLPDEPPVLAFRARLLSGVEPTQTLSDALNTINARDHFYKAYWSDGDVILEYEQIVEDLSGYRLATSLQIFRGNADHLDNMLQDRFGGQTVAAGVKARFNV